MTISSGGAYTGVSEEEQLGSGTYTTAIIGANVSHLLNGCVRLGLKALVLLHPADGSIDIEPEFNWYRAGFLSRYVDIDVYTDCAAAIAALSTEEQAKHVTMHSLSEWNG